jgi:trimeric autotransporter adhesin
MKDFTSQQKEIVARKLGYDGPMQGFDEFIASSPALGAKYAAITGKFAERMAKGGLVKMKRKFQAGGAVTNEQIAAWWADPANQKLSDAEIKAAMDTYKVSPDQFATAIGANEATAADIAKRYEEAPSIPATPTTPDVVETPAVVTPPEDVITPPASSGAKTITTPSTPVTPPTTVVTPPVGGTTATTDTTGTTPPVGGTTAGGGTAAGKAVAQTATAPPVSNFGYKATPQNIADWWKENGTKGLTDAQIKANMIEFKVSPEEFATAIGANAATAADITKRFNAVADKDLTTASTNLKTELQPKVDADKAAADAAAKAAADAATKAAADALAKANADLAKAKTEAERQAALAAKAKAEADAAAAKAARDKVTFSPVGKPQAGAASQVEASLITSTDGQKISTEERAGEAQTITGAPTVATSLATAPTALTAEQVTASTAGAGISDMLKDVKGAEGVLSEEAKVTAAQTEATALKDAADRAAQIDKAQTVQAPADRTLQEGEKVAGSAVDMAKVNEELAKAKAAEGTVTEEMTVQGQLTKLTKDFDAKNPPPWAAGALRAITAEMGARGIGASTIAGAAMVQAALEKALPIASADAAVFQQMATQNLSNRQQMAVLVAQQRATFLGQEFDQNFQTRVINASKISDIANMNFNAKQQVALENARLAQSVDLANLNSRQAAFMAELAQTATLETANLNNRQQAAVENAKAALQMDLTNLSNEQQTTMLKTQITAQALLSDSAAENAAKQFNATSVNQSNQFFATLSSQVSQFNAAQNNAMTQFNTDQANSVSKFNAEVKNQREQFNAQQRLVIDQSNAQWQREISTANTAATNAANLVNAQLTQQMTMTEYNNEIQLYRDAVTHAWQSAENDANRATTLAASEIAAAAAITGANIKADGDSSAAIGTFVARVLLGA